MSQEYGAGAKPLFFHSIHLAMKTLGLWFLFEIMFKVKGFWHVFCQRHEFYGVHSVRKVLLWLTHRKRYAIMGCIFNMPFYALA